MDRAFLLLHGPTDARGVYVPMTRGRGGNEEFVVTDADHSARDVLADALARDWIDTPAVVRRSELCHPRRVEPIGDRLEPERLRALIEREHEIGRYLADAEQGIHLYGRQRDRATEQRSEVAGRLLEHERCRDQARTILDELDRPVLRRLHRQKVLQARTVHREAQLSARKAGARLVDLDGRVDDLRASLAEANVASAERPGLERERHGIRRLLDRDRTSRAQAVGADPPDCVLTRLGPRPERGAARGPWDDAAAHLVQYEEAFSTGGVRPARGHRWDETPAMASARAADQACERFDRAAGRTAAIEAPAVELGISR